MNGKSQPAIPQLVALARGGDNSAQGKILETFRVYLQLVARLKLDRQLQGKISPSDVVQDTFLSARKAFPRFRGETERELMAWLRSILAAEIAGAARHYNRNRRSIKREKSLWVDTGDATLPGEFFDSTTSPSGKLARREAEVQVAEALSCLKEEHREVIILRSFEQLEFSDVANRMQRSTAAVKSLWVRALANLRKALKETSATESGSDQ